MVVASGALAMETVDIPEVVEAGADAETAVEVDTGVDVEARVEVDTG